MECAEVDIDGAVSQQLHGFGWRHVRWAAYVGYLGVLIALAVIYGVHTGWGTLAITFSIGLLLTTIGRHWRTSLQVVIDWAPFITVLIMYDRTRHIANSLGIAVHEADIVHAEKWCFGGTEPTIWLQHHLYNPSHVYWYDALITLVYCSHFVATPVLAALLWLRDRAIWVRYIARVTVLGVVGLLTYCVFPEAPPWMAAEDGLTAPVARLSARGWSWLHADGIEDALDKAQNTGSNLVAAMPSLHIAFATLVAIMIATKLRSPWRYLLALYPLAMGFALVYTGEHYILDLIVGVLYALAAHYALNCWEARRARRHVEYPAAPVVDEAPEPESAGLR